MLKWICRTSVQGAVLALGFLTLGIGEAVDADPRQDFSYSLSSKTGSLGERVRWMPLTQIEAILKDRFELNEGSESSAVDARFVSRVAEHLLLLCRRFRFDPAFILALIQAESGFRVRAESPAGALGLMQLMPASAAVIARQNGWKWGGAETLFDARTNLSLGISYLASLRHKYRSRSPYFFVAAYNIGPARMDELLARPSFRPVQTLKYYREIQKWLPTMWSYPVTDGASRIRRAGGGNRV